MYQRESKGWFKHYDFILLDLICLQMAFFLAYVIVDWAGTILTSALSEYGNFCRSGRHCCDFLL